MHSHTLNSSHDICHHCDREFGSPSMLLKHYSTCGEHFFCLKCTHHFPDTKTLQKHITTSPKHFYCHDCHIDYDSEDELSTHYATSVCHHFCMICSELLPSDESLISHINALHYPCWACDVYFTTEKCLKKHYKEGVWKSSGEKHASCGTCSEGFKDDEELCLHLSTTSGHHWCLRCRKDCGTESKLFKHRAICPKRDKPDCQSRHKCRSIAQRIASNDQGHVYIRAHARSQKMPPSQAPPQAPSPPLSWYYPTTPHRTSTVSSYFSPPFETSSYVESYGNQNASHIAWNGWQHFRR